MDAHDMTVSQNGQSVPAYFARPSEETLPAVILIEEIWGMNEHIRDVSRRLAAEGYVVLAPDILHGTGVVEKLTPQLQLDLFDPIKRHEAQRKLREALAPMQSPAFGKKMVDKLQACYAYLRAQKNVGKIGVMGFCFGGTYSFALAVHQNGISAAIPFYGQSPMPPESVEKIQCPILAFYGEKDERLVSGLPQLTEAMTVHDKEFSSKVYPNTGHAFFNDTNKQAYDADAATDAWKLSLEFLKKNLS